MQSADLLRDVQSPSIALGNSGTRGLQPHSKHSKLPASPSSSAAEHQTAQEAGRQTTFPGETWEMWNPKVHQTARAMQAAALASCNTVGVVHVHPPARDIDELSWCHQRPCDAKQQPHFKSTQNLHTHFISPLSCFPSRSHRQISVASPRPRGSRHLMLAVAPAEAPSARPS